MFDIPKRSFRLDDIGELQYQLAVVSPEFEETVISHILGNYMNYSPFPLYLAIHGPKGEGKTFQTLRACAKYGITIYYVSGAELCGSYEKDSVALIEQSLDEATLNYKARHILSVFIIDDFHLSVASVNDGVSKTVNSQILTGWLMNLADRAKAEQQSRIPFIFLGNDFANLYAPLTRDGRMDFYEWKPSEDEKKKIICAHFEDYIQGDRNWASFHALISKYHLQPISFFAELKNDLLKSLVIEEIQTCRSIDTSLLLRKLNNISDEILTTDSFDLIKRLETLAVQREKATDARLTIHESRGAL